MQGFGGEAEEKIRPHALSVWWVCTSLLLGPSILAWLVRLAALALHCAPGPGLCGGMGLGGGFRDTLDLAWLVAWDPRVSLAIAFIAAIAALRVCRPLLASLTLLLMPLAALILPTLAVVSAAYPGCQPNEDGIGDCVLWGANMGLDFHRAAMVSGPLYAGAPYSTCFALMVGFIGLLFFRQQAAKKQHNPFSPFNERRVSLRARDFEG